MPSTFTWLDYAEQDRQRMLDVIALLGEHDTRDELGIGTIRDTLAELLFPGINTIQTRARYFLFIPWMYRQLEQARVPSRLIADRARTLDIVLINMLKTTDEKGVFGRNAGASLKRFPSSVYWHGLRRWGIRIYEGAQPDYYRWVDRYYRELDNRATRSGSEYEEQDPQSPNWHAGIPSEPAGFPNVSTFALSYGEAEYLRERILASVPGTVLAFLVDCPPSGFEVTYVWQHPQIHRMPEPLLKQVMYARDFSMIMHGAALLYNLMLAELADNQLRIDGYRARLQEWGEQIAHQTPGLLTSDRDSFWKTICAENQQIPIRSRLFCDQWMDLIQRLLGDDLASDVSARDLIAGREQFLKRGQARLTNRRALEMWNGAAGVGQMNYRWPNAQTILDDIYEGLSQEAQNA